MICRSIHRNGKFRQCSSMPKPESQRQRSDPRCRAPEEEGSTRTSGAPWIDGAEIGHSFEKKETEAEDGGGTCEGGQRRTQQRRAASLQTIAGRISRSYKRRHTHVLGVQSSVKNKRGRPCKKDRCKRFFRQQSEGSTRAVSELRRTCQRMSSCLSDTKQRSLASHVMAATFSDTIFKICLGGSEQAKAAVGLHRKVRWNMYRNCSNVKNRTAHSF